jgi:hypothetical protein
MGESSLGTRCRHANLSLRFDHVPDPRADNARHDLGELLVIAFVAVFCGSTSCAGMARYGQMFVTPDQAAS